MNTAAAIVLGVLRLWAILRQQVLWREMCGPVWEACAAAFAILFALGLPSSNVIADTFSLTTFGLLAACELALGSILGALVSLPGHAVLGALQTSGQTLWVPPQTGFRLWGTCLTGLCGVALGLHHPLLAALLDLQMYWPIGHPEHWLVAASATDLLGEVIGAAHHTVLLSLSLATPVLLCAAIFDLTLRLLARGSGPWVFGSAALRPWIVWATATVALAASWAAYPGAWARGLG